MTNAMDKTKEKSYHPLGPGDSFPSHALVTCQNASTDQFSRAEEDLQEHIDRKIFPKKEKSSMLADTYHRLGYKDRAIRVSECGSFLQFALLSDCSRKLTAANFCRDRLCPMCNWRRSLKVFSQVSKVMDYLESQGYRYLFLTLTLRNEAADKFPAMIQALYDGWRFLYHKNQVFKKVICGTLRTVEVTINREKNTYHAHLHVVLAVRPDYFMSDYIDQANWSSMWAHACDLDYSPIVDIRQFKSKSDSSGIGSAVAEACKYAMKDSEYLVGSDSLRASYVSVLLHGLAGRRLFDKTGCFRKAWQDLHFRDPDSGDLTDDGTLQLRDDISQVIRYGWRSGVYVRLTE